MRNFSRGNGTSHGGGFDFPALFKNFIDLFEKSCFCDSCFTWDIDSKACFVRPNNYICMYYFICLGTVRKALGMLIEGAGGGQLSAPDFFGFSKFFKILFLVFFIENAEKQQNDPPRYCKIRFFRIFI